MSNLKSKEIRLKSRPDGMPSKANFDLVEVPVPAPKAGEFIVRNAYMSVDPYMRGRMVDRESYVPPFQIGEALTGGAVGQVIESQNPSYKVGDYVQHMLGWREIALIGSDPMSAMATMKVDPSIAPIQSYLGALGMPGLTAYAGLLRIGALKEGETVFVSAASGAVGAIVCQIAKNKGCFVVGSAGSDDKCQWLKDKARVDATINYKKFATEEALTAELKRLAPKGIDVYFENVGGIHLTAALSNMRAKGRVVMCGMIEQYNNTAPAPGPWNIIMTIPLGLRIEGFVVSNHFDLMGDFLRDMGQWIKAGKMTWHETIVDGIETAPEAFLGLFKGANFGKMLVRVGPDKAV
ncbi:MAG: zinc-binding dehydrogenase [Alphaproteobacteria bacterium]|nr:zinc-binding dehydrogenase [Alphaproteobacteria bacterium]